MRNAPAFGNGVRATARDLSFSSSQTYHFRPQSYHFRPQSYHFRRQPYHFCFLQNHRWVSVVVRVTSVAMKRLM